MNKMMKVFSSVFAGAVLSAAALSSANAQIPDLGPLLPYALFGNASFLNLATVNGNVGVPANGSFQMSAPSFINGRLDADSGVTLSIADPSHISGGIHLGVNLAAAQALVFSASMALRNLSANYTLGNVTTAQTFASTGAVTVIDMNSLSLGGSNNISLSGGPNDVFVLNIAHGVSLTGSSIIGAGVDPSHILLNFYDNTGNLGTVAHINNVLNGTLFVPFDSATFHSMNGAIWAGDGLITLLMSGATLTGVPFVPEVVPNWMILAGLVFVTVAGSRRAGTGCEAALEARAARPRPHRGTTEAALAR